LAISTLDEDYSRRFSRLSERHIFQWTTNYLEDIRALFSATLALLGRGADRQRVTEVVTRNVQEHSAQIYTKGYEHVTQRLRFADREAITKSIGGLASFLMVPVRVYSENTFGITDAQKAFDLRSVCSAFVRGILIGYGATTFGSSIGWSLLPLYQSTWISFLPFLRAPHARDILARSGHFDQGLEFEWGLSVVPVLVALDQLPTSREPGWFTLPVVSEFHVSPRRIAVALQLPGTSRRKRFLDVELHGDSGALNPDFLVDMVGRDVDLIAVPLTDELVALKQTLGPNGQRILDVAMLGADISGLQANLAERAEAIIHEALLRNLGEGESKTAIIHNYATDFPLESPARVQFFLVHRASVARLLRRFEGDTGIRLWCSLRRSGKSTACRDLGSFSGRVLVVNQTMNQDRSQPELNVFYDAVAEALDARRQLPHDFLEKVVRQAAALRGENMGDATKLIFVLDEYEQLFGRLRAFTRLDESVVYTVAHPLLEQFVDFGRQNLVVLLGQEPDAHYILMDHNQLSPLIKQDQFPLFEHGVDEDDSEFMQFLRRVMSENVECEPGFADLVYAETSGHPYLTVNVMVEFFDWLIKRRRHARQNRMSKDDWNEFEAARLSPTTIEKAVAYSFMSNVATAALGTETKRRHPWLHSVIIGIRRLAQEYPKTLECSEPEFQSLIRSSTEELGWPPAHVLRAAQMANFLTLERGNVRPAVRLFGRIAAVARPPER